jgi:L-alanine-DL-glutamate epimerase-like enolase superfamily enzyme
VSGLGYTYTLGAGGAGVLALLEEMAEALVGEVLHAPRTGWERIDARFQRVGHAGAVSVALAALDVAIWDAFAVSAGLPLHRFLGGTRTSVPAYGSSIDLGYPIEQLAATVEEHLRRGLRAVKVKVGRELAEDHERLAMVRAAIGPERALMVDANLGWDRAEAARRAEDLRAFDLTWLEEPLHPDDVAGHAALQSGSRIPLAAGETLFSVADFQRYLDARAIAFVQADVARLGGITPFLRVAELAYTAELPMAPHFLQDVHVQLLCAIPNGHILEHLPLLDAVIEHPLAISPDGTVSPGTRPGVGVSFREDVLAPYRVAGRVFGA